MKTHFCSLYRQKLKVDKIFSFFFMEFSNVSPYMNNYEKLITDYHRVYWDFTNKL